MIPLTSLSLLHKILDQNYEILYCFDENDISFHRLIEDLCIELKSEAQKRVRHNDETASQFYKYATTLRECSILKFEGDIHVYWNEFYNKYGE